MYIMITVNTGVQLVLERSRCTACHAPDSWCEEGRRQALRRVPTVFSNFEDKHAKNAQKNGKLFL